MIRVFKPLAACLLMVLSTAVSAQEPLRVQLGTFHIPLLVESATEGRFVDVARRVADEAGVVLDIQFMPTQRTRDAFLQNELEGFFPALSGTLSGDYSATLPFSTKRIYAYTLKDGPVIHKAEELAGHQVGFTQGFTYPAPLMSVPGTIYEGVNTDPQNLQKLLAGRIDVFLGDEISTQGNIRQLNAQDRILYDEARPLAVLPIFFAFQDNERGRMLTRRFNEAISRLQADGELWRIIHAP